jgi:hypothetical protein
MRHLGAIIGLGLALVAMAACGGKEEGGGGGGGSTDTDGFDASTDAGSTEAGATEADSTDATAALCTMTGGKVVQTFCFANPPFAQYTCASGENGAICDPGPGQTPTTPECICPGSSCFDPVMGCTAAH